jgi:two-component system chemotaxis sensor kinase CheA
VVDPLLAGLLQDYVDECLPLAQQVGAAVLELEGAWDAATGGGGGEAGDGGAAQLRVIKSALHTVKGGSAMLGLTPIEALAHGMEDVVAAVSERAERRGPRELELLLEGADLLIALVQCSAKGEVDPAPTQSFLRHLQEVLEAAPGGEGRASGETSEARLKPGASAGAATTALVTTNGGAAAAGAAGATGGGAAAGAAAGADDGTSIRIDDRKVDELMELASETVVTHTELLAVQARAARGPLNAADLATFDAVVSALGRTTRRLREELLRIRLMPVSSLFVRFRRYVRDLARERGQNVLLTIEGAETTLDRGVLTRLHEPLLHMVRNAFAHGIETPEQRRAAGKPEEANLLLAAKLVSGRVKIAVVDDGRGLDLTRIAAKASSLGVDTDGLSEEELRRLIFMPNFSTAAAVSNLAGRGVGLDVVAEAIHALGGSVDVESAPGAGTAFLLNLPVTISQLKGLVVSVDGELYIVPLGFVLESVAADPRAIHEVGHVPVMSWRGELVPVIDTGALVGTASERRAARRGYCVILSSGNRRRGLLVDRLLRRQDVVIKGLDESLGPSKVVFGLSILGDGRVAPILDCAQILGQTAAPRTGGAWRKGSDGGGHEQTRS